MATLVQFLAAGVNGAASGSATFFLRGTSSSAQSVMYNQFEGLTQPPNNIVDLDSNGAAEVYVDAYVDVEIKNSAGVTLRTVTVGNSAPVVEVQSTSFTGTDYDGSPANTVGEPITLKALLDKWILSAGAPDWQVLVGGVATDFDAAFAGVVGLIVNVKDPTYGATGDGVTDDTTAIIAANAAAAGRPVYFPPGTYKVSTITLTDANLNWFGAGVGASIISGLTSANLLNFTDATNTSYKNISGLSFTSSGAYTRFINLSNGQNVNINQCSFDGTNCTESCVRNDGDAGFSSYRITNCDFTVGSSTAFAIRNAATGGARQYFIDSCTFTVPAGFTGDVVSGADMNVTGCVFDASLVVSGVYYHVDAEGSPGEYSGSFVGNTFYDGGSDGFAFKLTDIGTDSNFVEDSNTFAGFTPPADPTEPGHIYDTSTPGTFTSDTVVVLGSRRGRSIAFVYDASNSLTDIECQLVAENVFIEYEGTGNFTIRYEMDSMVPNMEFSVFVNQADPADTPRDVILTDGIDLVTEAGVLADGRAFFSVKTYVRLPGIAEPGGLDSSIVSSGQQAN